MGYIVAQLADLGYDMTHVLVTGRVLSGGAARYVVPAAEKVLALEFPELSVTFAMPDDNLKAVGQVRNFNCTFRS